MKAHKFLASILFFFALFRAEAINDQTKPPLKVVMLQFDPIAGDMEYNFEEIRNGYLRALADGADIVITPELAVEGYTAGDLFERPDIVARSKAVVEKLRALTQGHQTALLVGHISDNPIAFGKPLQNDATAFVDGQKVHRHSKILLPDYDVYNDARWFHPGTDARVWEFKGHRIAVAICEDWWGDDKFDGPQGQRRFYARDPARDFAHLRVDLGISLSASPYRQNKAAYREDVHADVARLIGAPFIWNGMSGATDSLLFDGRSFILDAEGKTVDRLGYFRNDYAVVNFPKGAGKNLPIEVRKDSAGICNNPVEEEVVYQALLTGIREYMRRNNQKGLVLGVSGGIDSAVVAALIADAIGAENLYAVSMPSQYSSDHSKGDALDLVRNLGVPPKNMETISIEELHAAARIGLKNHWKEGERIDENSQARARMLILNGIANAKDYLVAVTGNKTEYAMGYFTFGGDDKGGLAILGGLWKSEVYRLARYINERAGRVRIPINTIEKPASAELKDGQVSYGADDGMPPYEILDPLLMDYFEFRIAPEVLHRKYVNMQPRRNPNWVYRVLKSASDFQEFKRRQAAPLLQVDRRKSFDWNGRRLPIAKTGVVIPHDFSDCERTSIPVPAPVIEWFPNTLSSTLLQSAA